MERLIEELHRKLGKQLPRASAHHPGEHIVRVMTLDPSEVPHLEEVLEEEGYSTLSSVPGWNTRKILDFTRRQAEDGNIDLQMAILTYNKDGGIIYTEVHESVPGSLGMAERGSYGDQHFVVGGKNSAEIARKLHELAPHIFAKDKCKVPIPKDYAEGEMYKRGHWKCINLEISGRSLDSTKLAIIYNNSEKLLAALKKQDPGMKEQIIYIRKGDSVFDMLSPVDVMHLTVSPEERMTIEVRGDKAEQLTRGIYEIVNNALDRPMPPPEQNQKAY